MSEDESKTDEAAPEARAGVDVSASEPEAPPPEAKAKKKASKKKLAADAALADPRAKAIDAAFDAGDFQKVRTLAAELAASGTPALEDIGRDYARRIAIDPVQIAFLGLCAMALLTIAWIYIPH